MSESDQTQVIIIDMGGYYIVLSDGALAELNQVSLPVARVVELSLPYPDAHCICTTLHMYLASDSKRTTKLVLMKHIPI